MTIAGINRLYSGLIAAWQAKPTISFTLNNVDPGGEDPEGPKYPSSDFVQQLGCESHGRPLGFPCRRTHVGKCGSLTVALRVKLFLHSPQMYGPTLRAGLRICSDMLRCFDGIERWFNESQRATVM